MRVYLQPKFLGILLLSIISGAPLSLTASTLTTMLAESEIDIKLIGLFAMVAIPYSFKYLWAPLIDNIKIPIFHKLFGRRRSWMILTLSGLATSVALVSTIDIKNNIEILALIAISISFLSATFDIIYDAFRIELLKEEEQAAGASVYVFGYRIGMLVSSAGALYIAHFYNWEFAYICMSLLIASGILFTLFMKEKKSTIATLSSKHFNFGKWLLDSYILPFKDFISRVNPIKVLTFIILFKLGDAYAGLMTNPFLISLGFSKLEIANIVKGIGIIATLTGAFIGGGMASKLSLNRCIFIALVLQILSNLAFIPLIYIGHNNYLLAAVITIENFTGGIGTSILLAYLATLCNKSFTATQFALLTSFASLGRSTISGSAGYSVETLGWEGFFILSALLSVPAIFLINSKLHSKKISSTAVI